MKLLTVHSLAAHGTASLKAFLSILGTRVIPVPSLYLTGLTSLPGIRRFSQELEGALEGTLELARQRGEPVMLYVGYLGNAAQVDAILKLYERYQEVITQLLVDPVTGDHGRIYVPAEVVEAWPRLLARADWAFPNFTELKIYSGIEGESVDSQGYTYAFCQRFSNLQFVATSLPTDTEQLRVFCHHNEGETEYTHTKMAQNFGGTGDAFAAHFVKRYFFEMHSLSDSLQQAADQTLLHVQNSIARNSPDLIIEP